MEPVGPRGAETLHHLPQERDERRAAAGRVSVLGARSQDGDIDGK